MNKILQFFQFNFGIVYFSSLIKVPIFWLIDLLNKMRDPFKYLSIKLKPRYLESLGDKAEKFKTDLEDNFLLYGTIWNYRKPTDGSIDMGDQALHHGFATVYWALQWSLTKSSADLHNLNTSVTGLNAHQTIHGEPVRRLVRGFKYDSSVVYPTYWNNGEQHFFCPKPGLVVEDSVSNDTLSGHLAGIYFAWLYGTLEIQERCNVLISGLADELINNSDCLINQDGSKAVYSKLADGVLADPLRISLLLAIYKVASKITQDAKYHKAYKRIYRLYGLIAPYAKLKLWAWGNDPDEHRAALHLSILVDLDDNKRYIKGLKRVWRLSKKSMNVWVAFLAHRHGLLSANEIVQCKEYLSTFTLEDKQTDIQKDNSAAHPEVKIIKWGKRDRREQVLERWRCAGQDNIWQRNRNAVKDWMGNTSPSQYFQGVDYLLCWTLGRVLNIISDKE